MYKKILLAIDGSPSSKEVAKHAVLYSALRFPKSREVKEIAGKKIKLHTKILEGPPWVKIVEEAEKGKYDIIIMGSKGRGALGSVAEMLAALC